MTVGCKLNFYFWCPVLAIAARHGRLRRLCHLFHWSVKGPRYFTRWKHGWFATPTSFRIAILEAYRAMGAMATIPLATAEATTANDVGAVVTWSVSFSNVFLRPDESSSMYTNNPLEALLDGPLIKTSSWSTSQVSSATTSVCSAMLITRSSKLSLVSCVNCSTILKTSALRKQWFSTWQGFPVELYLDLGCSQSYSARVYFMTFISCPSLA